MSVSKPWRRHSINSHEEDLWPDDWEYESPADLEEERDYLAWLYNSSVGKRMDDVISPLLNDVPEVIKTNLKPGIISHAPALSSSAKAPHVHIWRKEYRMCMIKGCGAKRSRYVY